MEKIETQLKRLTPELSMHESQVLWSRVQGSLAPRGKKSPKKNPARRTLFRAVTAGLVIGGLLGGSVFTAYASEALPGDPLYATKITIERVQIVLAPVEKKKDMQLAFANRRIKEVSAVLADIEEEQVDSVDPTLMAVSAPSPEVVTMAFSLPADEPSTEDAAPAMKAVSAPITTEVVETEAAENARTERSAGVPRESDVSDSKMMLPMPAIQAQDARIQDQVSMKQQKRWKNLENKKKALAVAIKELERTSVDLRHSGATTTSQNVDTVIVNLMELNEHGTTPDQTFVEKVKNSEIEVVDVEEKNENRTSDEKRNEKVEREGEDSARSIRPETQGATVFLSGNEEVSDEVKKEVEEVKVRNDERRKRNKSLGKRFTPRERPLPDERVPVCIEAFGHKEELLVLKEDLSRYKENGFVEGSCGVMSTRTDTSSTSSPEVSQQEGGGIIEE